MKYTKYSILITFLFIFNSCASLSLFSPETHNHYTNSNDSSNKNEPVVNKANTINLFNGTDLSGWIIYGTEILRQSAWPETTRCSDGYRWRKWPLCN